MITTEFVVVRFMVLAPEVGLIEEPWRWGPSFMLELALRIPLGFKPGESKFPLGAAAIGVSSYGVCTLS